MTDLIFHIGLSKCGSTTLQNAAFSKEDGYFGTARGLPIEMNFAKQLRGCAPVHYQLFTNRKRTRAWADRLRKTQQELWPGIGRLLMSDELLTSGNLLRSHPVIGFLKWVQREVWKEGRVRVLLVLRNQTARLGSAYAEQSCNVLSAGQNDFELFVKRKLARSDQWDYAEWVSKLYRAFGRDDCCVLLLEEASDAEFWETLIEFSNLKKFDYEDIISGAQNVNVRSIAENIWQIRPFDARHAAKGIVDKWTDTAWPRGAFPALRCRANSVAVERLSIQLQKRFDAGIGGSRSDTVSITPCLKKQISIDIGNSNRKLAQLLNRDLSGLGY